MISGVFTWLMKLIHLKAIQKSVYTCISYLYYLHLLSEVVLRTKTNEWCILIIKSINTHRFIKNRSMEDRMSRVQLTECEVQFFVLLPLMSKAGGLIRDHSPPLSNVIILLCSSLWKLLFLVSWLAMYTPFRPFIFVRSTNASLAKCLEKNIPQILKLLKILYQLGSFYTCTNGILLAWITFLAIQKVAFCHKDVIKI